MRLHFKDLNSVESISQAFGFQVPLPFAEFLMNLYKYCQKDNQEVSNLFERLTGQMLDGEDMRYPQTPPELFPIASMGVDGVHYGYVIHAPELPAEDYPVGEICPMDDDGVILVGNTTQEALENFGGYVIEGEKDEKERQEISDLYKFFGLRPNSESNKIRYLNNGKALPITPSIPANWLYIPTADGIGVLAPAEKFRNEPLTLIKNLHTPDEFLKHADKASHDNFPATALYYLREGFWLNWTDSTVAQSFSSRMMKTYMELNRPVLARVTEWKAIEYFD